VTPDDLLTRKEAAAYLRVSVRTFVDRIEPDLYVLDVGTPKKRLVRVRRRHLDRWVELREAVHGSS
jgi:hypothetical protein